VSNPKVSVFIASYNHARFLPQCLDSILQQTWLDFEIVVVDDGSTDNTHEILLDYERRFPGRVRYFWHPGHANKGISATSNLALAHSDGEYLAWTGSDDMWYPDKLALQVAQLDAHPEFGFVYSYADLIDTSGSRLPGLYGTDITGDPNPAGRMIHYCHAPAMTVVIRRECLNDVGHFDEKLVYSDWELWIRVLARWKAGFLDRSTAMYRMHGRNVSKKINSHVDLRRTLDMMTTVREKIRDLGGALLLPRNLALVNLQIASLLFCDGQQEAAAREFRSAFDLDPSLKGDPQFLDGWLNSWKPEYYSPAVPHFGFWAISQSPKESGLGARLLGMQLAAEQTRSFFVSRGIQRGRDQASPESLTGIFDDCPAELCLPWEWKSEIFRQVYAALLFDSAEKRDVRKVRYYWPKAVKHDPSWLLNRGVLSIGLRAFVVPRTLS
jgi:glycosyltransferase involved in cell wall biosynthesis